MRRVLITGGSGQIGSALVSSAPPDYEIYAPDSRRLDIKNVESIADTFERFRPDLVINCAAYTAVDKAETERELAFAINAGGAGHLARACRVAQAPLLHLSTDYVFDGAKTSAYIEDDEPNPINVYGESKLAGERQIVAAQIPYLILRVSWVFSAMGTNFVKTMLRLAERESLNVVDDQSGTPCAAEDIAKVLWTIAGRFERDQEGELMHFSSAPATTWFEFASVIFEAALARGMVSRVPRLHRVPTDGYPTAARRPLNSLLDSSRLQHSFGFEPPDWRTSLDHVLGRIVDARSSRPLN